VHIGRGEGTHALVVVPTRELCLQICDVLTLILRRFVWLARSPKPCPCHSF
jgi:ATP-dependent RNA helicase DDX31/DBP7